jgi:hypothetical protein
MRHHQHQESPSRQLRKTLETQLQWITSIYADITKEDGYASTITNIHGTLMVRQAMVFQCPTIALEAIQVGAHLSLDVTSTQAPQQLQAPPPGSTIPTTAMGDIATPARYFDKGIIVGFSRSSYLAAMSLQWSNGPNFLIFVG